MPAGIDHIKALEDKLGAVVEKILARTKDGVGVDDAIALATDGDFRADIAAIVEHSKHVKDEATDLTFEEGVALIQPTSALLLRIIKAAKA